MPRRALVLITALVLAAHWLMLGGIPLGLQASAPTAEPVFSTRSIPAPMATPAEPLPSAIAGAAPARPAPPRQRKPAPPRTVETTAPQPPEEPPVATPGAPPTPEPPAATPDVPSDTGAAASPLAERPEPGGEPPSEPSTSQPTSPSTPPASAPPALPAPADATAQTGVDIRSPGGGRGQAASSAAPPVRLPPPTRLAFDVMGQAKRFAYSASAELLWQHDGNRYEARQEISAFLVGKRTQRSTGNITPQGLQPERFSDRSRSEQAAHFDHAQGRVTFSANTPEAVTGAGAQDRLSVFIQLGALLAADPARFVPGTEIALTTVSTRSADRWTFTIEGPETLDLPAGTLPALKLQRLPRKDYDQKAELWVAPSLGYLPVRIRITQANGDFADLQLRSRAAP